MTGGAGLAGAGDTAGDATGVDEATPRLAWPDGMGRRIARLPDAAGDPLDQGTTAHLKAALQAAYTAGLATGLAQGRAEAAAALESAADVIDDSLMSPVTAILGFAELALSGARRSRGDLEDWHRHVFHAAQRLVEELIGLKRSCRNGSLLSAAAQLPSSSAEANEADPPDELSRRRGAG